MGQISVAGMSGNSKRGRGSSAFVPRKSALLLLPLLLAPCTGVLTIPRWTPSLAHLQVEALLCFTTLPLILLHSSQPRPQFLPTPLRMLQNTHKSHSTNSSPSMTLHSTLSQQGTQFFCCFKQTLFLSFRFTAKLSRVLIYRPLHTQPPPPSTPHTSGTLQSRNLHPCIIITASSVSMGLNKCMARTHHHTVVSSFTTVKTVSHLFMPLPATRSFYCLLTPFQNVIPYVAFSDELLSLSNMHCFLHIFSWLDSSFPLSTT